MSNESDLARYAATGNLKKVKDLLGKKANIEYAHKRGLTALIYAAQAGHIEIVQALLDADANVNHATESGETALIKA